MLLNLLFCSSCLTVPLLLLGMLLHSYYSTCCFAPLVQPFCSSTFLLFLAIFVQRCCSIPFVSNWYFSPLIFLHVWSVEKLSKFEFFKPNLELRIFVFNFGLLMSFLKYPCFWKMVVNNVFVCCVEELFGHCTFNYIHYMSLLHIAFH
jgi:hypothetical protein